MRAVAPPLPYRPLEVRGHGVWDPERKAFYPFCNLYYDSSSTVPGKKGYAYYIHAYHISGENDGAWGAADIGFRCRVGGVVSYYYVPIPQTTAASGVGASAVATGVLDVLTDAGSDMGVDVGSTIGYVALVCAEIPMDEGES